MKIEVSSTSESEIKEFMQREWAKADLEHFGRSVSLDEWTPEKIIFQARVEGDLAGTIVANLVAGVIYIESIIVSSAHRGKGVGKQLLDQLEAYAQVKQAHKIYLFTGKTWPANAFYISMGYKKEGDLPNHSFGHDFVIYSKMLQKMVSQ